MRRAMMLFCVLAGLFGSTGCKYEPFYGRCTIEKVNGKVISVKVILPNKGGNANAVFECNNRDEMDKIINSLDSILLDLKAAREQMPVVEPPPEPPSHKSTMSAG